jgi:hypothetical protein
MKKKILVEKSAFDATLGRMLTQKPIAREKIKTAGKRGPKTPILAKQS